MLTRNLGFTKRFTKKKRKGAVTNCYSPLSFYNFFSAG